MRRALAAAVLAAAALAPAAAAHVEVTPTEVAPGEPALFTLAVPNEGESATVSVELKVPAGVVPYSFEETPGWTRAETRTPEGSLDVVRWEGSLPPGSFVRFSFLAATPEADGTIAWPAVQTYADGTVSRWIGDEGSDEPAAFTAVGQPAGDGGGDGDGNGALVALAIAGLAFGGAALVLTLFGRRGV